MQELVTAQLIGNVRQFEEHWSGDEVIPGQDGKLTHLVDVSPTSERYRCVDGRTPWV